MNYEKIAELLFPNVDSDITYYENKYPQRMESFVTRFAPSPTGFIHMGSLYTAYISYLFAKKNNGIFYLRIEDTDQNRKVENGIDLIVNDLKKFDIEINESHIVGGNYGPYIQSERKNIYLCFAKYLVEQGLAYPCFCTKEELDLIREEQEKNKDRIGYFGKWAKDRNLSLEEIKDRINKKMPFVIRLRSQGDYNKKIEIKDLIKGTIEFPENDIDVVLIKSDGLPTYHFAHAIDDHLMRTTHIIRGDEWLSSLPIHYELFKILKFKMPKYAHVAPINKKIDTTVRKLSKRYDPECNISYYYEKGIPTDVIKLYLATLINSNFENWYMNNINEEMYKFNFEFNKMSVSGPIFDIEKLKNISKTYFSTLNAELLYNKILKYYETYDDNMYKLLADNKDYTIEILNIERNKKRPRKDISCYSDFKEIYIYMYDEYFYKYNEKFNLIKNYKEILLEYINLYDASLDENAWFDVVKNLALKYNYAPTLKEYNENQNDYDGNITDICTLIRMSVTFRLESPNIYEILKVLGKDRVIKRINYFLEIQQ